MGRERVEYTLIEAPEPAYKPQVGWVYEYESSNAYEVRLRAIRTAAGEDIRGVHWRAVVPVGQFRKFWGRTLPPTPSGAASGGESA